MRSLPYHRVGCSIIYLVPPICYRLEIKSKLPCHISLLSLLYLLSMYQSPRNPLFRSQAMHHCNSSNSNNQKNRMGWIIRCECYWRVIRIWFIRITEMENLFRIGGDVLVRLVKRHDGWFTDEKNRSSGYQQVEKLTRNLTWLFL